MSKPQNLALRWTGSADALFLRLLPARPKAFIRRPGSVFIGFESADRFVHDSRTYEGDPFERLESWVDSHRSDDPAPRFSIGYISYDTKNLLRDFPRRPSYTPSYPEITFLHFTEGLFLDTRKNILYLRIPSASRRDEIAAHLLGLGEPILPLPATPTNVRFVPFPDYEKRILTIKDFLRRGDCYEVNHTERFSFDYAGSPTLLFARLLAESNALRATWIQDESLSILSATLEDFIAVRGDTVETKPIKGTRPASGAEVTDRKFVDELSKSEKDRAEHVMIVDVARNDLGRVCRPGTVRVTHPFSIHSFPTVHHMISTVEGRLRPDAGMADVLRAVFPGASVTGAPKIRATEIIDEMEDTPRGVYTGAIGMIAGRNDFDLSMAIRSVVLNGRHSVYGTGGGITIDSDPRAEYEECSIKTEILLRALFGGPPAVSDEEDPDLLAQRPISRPA